MKNNKFGVLIPAVAVILATGITGVRSGDELGAAPQVQPQGLQVLTSKAPFCVLAEQQDEMLERLAGQRRPLLPGQRQAENARNRERVEGGVSRVIDIDQPPIVNSAPFFRFRDVTDRQQADRSDRPEFRKVSDETRRRVVESYRQSVAKRSTKGRGQAK